MSSSNFLVVLYPNPDCEGIPPTAPLLYPNFAAAVAPHMNLSPSRTLTLKHGSQFRYRSFDRLKVFRERML